MNILCELCARLETLKYRLYNKSVDCVNAYINYHRQEKSIVQMEYVSPCLYSDV